MADRDSDSEDASDDEAFGEGDQWEEEPEEVSPEDERAMAAFMVRTPRCLALLLVGHRA